MKLETLLHRFEFSDETRADVTLSDLAKIRLDGTSETVQLKAAESGAFPLDDDLYAISPLFQPKAGRQWVGFQAFIQHAFDGLVPITSDGFRLHDGTNQYWWDSAAWVVNTTDWNTEAEVAANISTFPATARKLRVVVKLRTGDARVTPRLSAIKVAWKGLIPSYLEDIIYRSLVPAFRGIRYITDFVSKVPMPGGFSLNVGSALTAAGIPFNAVDVDSIFDHTADPEHVVNKLASYNPVTKMATLSSSIPVGNTAFIKVLVEPEVAVEQTSQDFVEVEKAPALVITDMNAVDSSPLSQDDGVVNKATGAAIRIQAPYRFDLRFTMIALAPGATDLMRFTESIVGFVENSPTLHSPALDKRYRLWLVNEFTSQTRPNRAELHSAQATFVIKDVLAFTKPAKTETAVMSVKLRGDTDVDLPFTP